ncbi:MAG: hypothetical protein DMG57_00735 [Acidobacteria bacterium]|nr:MAG: hypothetical protein DMG57_00735 [Acidobacteriota bacterium]
MNVALKEWSSVIAALDRGLQIFVLRKGGIVEERRGFELRHREFLLFPTFTHQHARYLKPEHEALALEPENGGRIRISHAAQVVDILAAPHSASTFRASDNLHIWNGAFILQRYEYRPDLPLYVIVLRILRLKEPQEIPARPSYAGCKSWVNLTEAISLGEAQPVLPESQFEAQRHDLVDRMSRRSGSFEH